MAGQIWRLAWHRRDKNIAVLLSISFLRTDSGESSGRLCTIGCTSSPVWRHNMALSALWASILCGGKDMRLSGRDRR